MTENKRADDVGDDVVEEEVRGEWFTCTNLPTFDVKMADSVQDS